MRKARGIDRWVLNGVSWGSTLALAYAQTHPERVLGMVLVAVTTTSRSEVDWITEGVGAIGAGGVHRDPRWDDPRFTQVFVTLATHYWSHDGFWDPPVLDRMDRLSAIPATLVHGRRDISSPAITPWRLHRCWPGSELIIDESAAHGGTSMAEHWAAASSRLADQLDTRSV